MYKQALWLALLLLSLIFVHAKRVAPLLLVSLLLASLVNGVTLRDTLVVAAPLEVGVVREGKNALDSLANLDVATTIVLGPD